MESIVIDYGLDPSGYMTGVGQVMLGNTQLQQSMAGVVTSQTLMQKALSMITPTRAVGVALTGFATQAGVAQQRLHALEATSTVTNVSVNKLSKGIAQMAQDFPIGADGAASLITQFTKMGIVGKGSEKQITDLSKSVVKLAGATGESTSTIADGMTTLSRVTGNANLNTKRFDSLGDSLATVSLKSGASASGILQLSKNIAPMANAAGIGATGILGISSAFARMGEDGLGASTAVNKMLSDMNKSIRDGGPEIMKYASIVGKTTAEFTALYKANPTEAIVQVTEALAKSGSAGPRQLESIGLDGVRTQRILQGMMSTGGLRPGVQQAVDAYGSGSSAKAAEAAYGSLQDSLGELSSASSNLAAELGAPLLTPLTMFTKGLTTATGFLGKIAGSDTGQNVLKTVGGVVGFALLAKGIVGTAATLGLGRQAATSGIVRSIAGAWGVGQGNPEGRMGRFGREATLLANSRTDLYGVGGQLGHVLDREGNSVMTRDTDRRSATYGEQIPKMRVTGNLERAMYQRTIAAAGAMPRGEGPGVFGQISRGVRQYGYNAAITYADSARQNLANQSGWAATHPFGRDDSWKASEGFKKSWAAAQDAGGMKSAVGLAAFHNALAGVNIETVKTRTVMMALAKGAGQAALQLSSLVNRTAWAGAKGAVKGGEAVLGKIGSSALGLVGGGAGLALMAGFAGYSSYQNAQEARASAAGERYTGDINATVNTYREKAGQAAKPQESIGTMGAAYAKSVSSGVTTAGQARNVTAEDMAAAGTTAKDVQHKYMGTAKEIAAQIAGSSVTGLTPSDIQNVKIDVARQFPSNQKKVQEIMDLLPQSLNSAGEGDLPKGTIKGSGTANLLAQIAPAINTGPGAEQSKSQTWWKEGMTRLEKQPGESDIGALNRNVGLPEWRKALTSGVGGGQHESTLPEKTMLTLTSAMNTSLQTFNEQAKNFSPEYAKQEQNKGYEAMLRATAKTGDAESYLELGRQMTAQMTGKKGGYDISPEMIKSAGGLENAVAKLDTNYAEEKKTRDALAKKQPGGVFGAAEKQSIESKNLETVAPMLSKLFDVRGAKAGSAQALSAISKETPDNLLKLDAAVKALTNSVGNTAPALGDLASQAAAAAAHLTEGTPEYTQAVAIQQRAQTKLESVYKEMAPSAVMAQQIPAMLKMVQNRDNTTIGDQQRKAGLEGLQGMKDQVQAQMTARVAAQRSADVGKSIAREDYGIQRQYQKEDYGVQVMRTERDANKSRKRAIEDFNLSVKRSELDYNVSRLRQVRDFNIQVKNSERDALISRTRAIRDFNINLKREMADAASSMFDPYDRIQSKPTWDSANMTANIQEQTDALIKQKKQLDELRAKGLSDVTINQLGLGKSENSQQLDNIASDAMTDPSQIKKLNAAAAAKAAAAGAMVTDSSNISLARGREDLAKSFADQNADLAKNLKDSRATLARNQSDQAIDFAKNLERSNADFRKSLKRNAFDLAVGLADMEFNQNVSLDRQERAFTLSLGRIDRALLEADKSVGQDFVQLSESYNKAIHGNAVNWNKTMVSDSSKMIDVVKTKLVPGLLAAWADSGLTPPAGVGAAAPKHAAGSGGKDRINSNLAEGGTVNGYSPHDKADNIPINATAGEFMQPVDSVKHYGVNAMEAIRTKKIPKELINGYYDGGLIAFGKKLQKQGFQVGEHPLFGGVNPVHTPGSWHYRGGAIDVNHDQGNEKSAIDAIIKDARASALRTIWQVTGHFDHAHFDIGKGGDMLGEGYESGGSGGGSGKSESGSGSGLTKAAIDAVMKKAPKGDKFYTGLLKTFENQLRATYEDTGAQAMSGPVTSSANSKLGMAMAASQRKWTGANASALNTLWTGESGWNNTAQNPTSTAYGIAQFLDSTWAGYGGPKTSDASKQITYGLNYIAKRYGDPSNALAKWQSRSPHWYDQGGSLPPGTSLVHNGTGKPETVLNPQQSELLSAQLTSDQGKALSTANGMHMTVNHNENITYDNRNDFGGAQFTVQSQDPDDMARQLEAKAVRGRVSQTRGVRAR